MPGQARQIGPYDLTALDQVQEGHISPHIHRVRELDWSITELGHMSSWSLEMRRMVNMCMTDPRAINLVWGPHRNCLFNQAFSEILADASDWAMGKPVDEIWGRLGASESYLRSLNPVPDANEPLSGDTGRFHVQRSSCVEEVWASWTSTPIFGKSGIEGFYCAFTEDTELYLRKRREAILSKLDQHLNSIHTMDELWTEVISALESGQADIPVAILYSPSSTDFLRPASAHIPNDQVASHSNDATPGRTSQEIITSQWKLRGTLGCSSKLDLPASLTLQGGKLLFGGTFESLLSFESVQRLHGDDKSLSQSLRDCLKSHAAGVSCGSALLIPLKWAQRKHQFAFLLLGLNAQAKFNHEYQRFVHNLTTKLIASMIAVSAITAEHSSITKALNLVRLDHGQVVQIVEGATINAQERENRFRSMADRAPVAMFEVGAQGDLKYANQAWWDMTAHSPARMAPLEWIDVIHPDDRAWFGQQWARLVTGETLKFEIRFAKPYATDDWINGERLQGTTWAAASAYAERDSEGNVKNILGTVADISRHKWIEGFEQRQSARAIEEKIQQEAFMDLTSHEIRNPLAAVSLCVESLINTLSGILTDPGDRIVVNRDAIATSLESAQTILSCVTHQESLVSDVLTLSKLNGGLLTAHPVETQPLKDIPETLKIFAREVEQAGLELHFVVDRSYHDLNIDWVRLDPQRLRQILVNLTVNAIKFTKTEAIRHVTVVLAATAKRPSSSPEGVVYFGELDDLHPSSPADDSWVYISLTVEDTGCGIEPQDLDHLFERFQQGSPRTHTRYGGSGLGLFICKELARLQGGLIGVRSRKGRGTTFTFYTKAQRCCGSSTTTVRSLCKGSPSAHHQSRKASNLQLTTENGTSNTSRYQFELMKVLLVEDNIVNQRVLARQLQRAGCEVTVACDGQEALNYLNSTSFCQKGGKGLDIVLMDIEMPVMDGLECTRRIREMQRNQQRSREIQKMRVDSPTVKIVGHVPLIAVTANARQEQQQYALDAGVDAVLTKPFQMSALLLLMDEVVARGQAS